MEVVFQYDASPGLRRRLEDLSTDGLRITPCPELDERRFLGLMAEAEVLFHVLRPVTAEIIERSPCLRLIQKIGVGVNTIDLDAARARAIQVANMPGTNSRAVAESALLLMLAILRRLPLYDRACRAGAGWAMDAALLDELGEMGGRTVGLVGFGAVVAALTPMLAGLGARVLYHSRSSAFRAGAEWRRFEDLLAEADIVSLHVPLTSATENLIDEAAIALMKPGAILINTARGGLVDEAALLAALGEGRLGGAGLDVFAHEPPKPDNPLFALDNVVFMPHVAWLTPETLERSLGIAVENCRRLERGEVLLHRVV